MMKNRVLIHSAYQHLIHRIFFLCLIPTFFLSNPVLLTAHPLNPTVISGSASFQQQGDLLSITNSAGAIIEWNQFSIAPHETTQFIQPHADSTVLNRITGQSPSEILGQLQSNGHVWLINPNGILFGADAQVDVVGLVASTLDISNHDFISGIGRFEGPEGAGSILHNGLIQTPTGGQVIMIAPQVENHGVIISPEGQILLAAGHKVELAELSNPALRVEVTAEGEALNIGQLIAESGQIGIHAGLVRQSGEVNASSAVMEGGRIFLRGTHQTQLTQDSLTTASGTQGGRIDITADEQVTLQGAQVEASGHDQGGLIRIGGAFQGGKEPDSSRPYHESFVGRWADDPLPQLSTSGITELDTDSSIRATASDGAGGTVIVWSDEITRQQASIDTRGSDQGGSIEISSSGRMPGLDLSKVTSGGTLLLDPKNIVVTAAGDPITGDLNFGDDPADDTVLDITVFNTLLGDQNITLQANNDITIDATIQPTQGTHDLTLIAGRSVNINDDIRLFTTGSDLLIIANAEDPAVVSAQREAGPGGIFMAPDTLLSASDVILRVEGGVAGATPAGDMVLSSVDGFRSTGQIRLFNNGGNILSLDGRIKQDENGYLDIQAPGGAVNLNVYGEGYVAPLEAPIAVSARDDITLTQAWLGTDAAPSGLAIGCGDNTCTTFGLHSSNGGNITVTTLSGWLYVDEDTISNPTITTHGMTSLLRTPINPADNDVIQVGHISRLGTPSASSPQGHILIRNDNGNIEGASAASLIRANHLTLIATNGDIVGGGATLGPLNVSSNRLAANANTIRLYSPIDTGFNSINIGDTGIAAGLIADGIIEVGIESPIGPPRRYINFIGSIPIQAVGSATFDPDENGEIYFDFDQVFTVSIAPDGLGQQQFILGNNTNTDNPITLDLESDLIIQEGELWALVPMWIVGGRLILDGGTAVFEHFLEVADGRGSIIVRDAGLAPGEHELVMQPGALLELDGLGAGTNTALRIEAGASVLYDEIFWLHGAIEGDGDLVLRPGGKGLRINAGSTRVLNAPNVSMSLFDHDLDGFSYTSGPLYLQSGTITVDPGVTVFVAGELHIEGGNFEYRDILFNSNFAWINYNSGTMVQLPGATSFIIRNGYLDIVPDAGAVFSPINTPVTIESNGVLWMNNEANAGAPLQPFNSALTIDNGGELRLYQVALDLNGQPINNDGTITLRPGASLINTNSDISQLLLSSNGILESAVADSGNPVREVQIPVLNDGGTIRATHGTLVINEGSGYGSFNASGGAELHISGPYLISDDSSFDAAANSQIRIVDNPLTLADSIQLAFSGPGSLVLEQDINSSPTNPALLILDNNGQLLGSATLRGDLQHNNATINPGSSPGTLTINGNYVMGPGSVLEIEIFDSIPGQYDVLVVNGTANLTQGSLLITTDGSFTPTGTFTLTPLAATNLVGTFSNAAAGSTLSGYLVNYPGNNMTLTYGASVTPITPPTTPPVTVPPTTPPTLPPGPVPVQPTPPSGPIPEAPVLIELTPELLERLIAIIQNDIVRLESHWHQVADLEVESSLLIQPDGIEPWNNQFEQTDRPNICRLMCN